MISKRMRAWLLSLCALATSLSLEAQMIESRQTSVSPVTTDVLLLTPAASSVTRPIVIDAASRAVVRVSALSQQLSVTLISPNGTRREAGSSAEAWTIDLRSGAVAADSVPWVARPNEFPGRAAGYVPFLVSDYPPHPLARSNMLRTDFDGSKRTRWIRKVQGGLRLGRDTYFDGVWRVIFGARPLLERRLPRAPSVPELRENVRIDPEGNLLVCTCADLRGTWIAVYSIKDLMRGAATSATQTEKR